MSRTFRRFLAFLLIAVGGCAPSTAPTAPAGPNAQLAQLQAEYERLRDEADLLSDEGSKFEVLIPEAETRLASHRVALYSILDDFNAEELEAAKERGDVEFKEELARQTARKEDDYDAIDRGEKPASLPDTLWAEPSKRLHELMAALAEVKAQDEASRQRFFKLNDRMNAAYHKWEAARTGSR
jgi:chromosome segregation ATPase